MSQTSLGSLVSVSSFLEEDAFSDSADENLLPSMFASNGRTEGPPAGQLSQYQVFAVAVKCPHNAMAVSCLHSPFKMNGLWLPYVGAKESYKFKYKIIKLLAEYLLRELNIPYSHEKLDGKVPFPFEKCSLHSLMRIQVPSGEFITRIIYLATWSSEATCCQAGSTSRTLKWIPLDTISNPTMASHEQQELVAQFWGSEVVTYAGHLNSNKSARLLASNKCSLVAEQTLLEMLKYIARSDISEDERAELDSPTTRMFTEFVAASKYKERDVIKLYSDFVQHCYPSTNMSFTSYKDYCEKIGLGLFLDDARLRKAFQASNYKFKNYLSFTEFLLGMVSLDPDSPHTRPRFSFIFRYYDSNSDGSLSQDDMKRLLTDLRRFIEWRMTTTSLNLTQFVEEISADRLKGTSSLCRSTRSILRMIKTAAVYEYIPYRSIPTGTQVNLNCCKCRPKNYTVATHSLALTPLGGLVDPLLAIRGTPEAGESREAKLMRDHSLEYIFKSTSYGNYVLDLVRKLRDINKMTEERKREVRTEVVNGLTLNVITGLCEEMSDLLQAESRVLQVPSPVFVLGDIHGNINDLLTFETQLWPMAPAGIGPSVLFLGDYVDRGEFGIEVVCYLFAMKLLAPNKFFLLRGNHEIRNIQRAFTFEKECMEKYANNGLSIFEIFNRAFDSLPFAAVIDESIFCAHGGIPFTIQTIEGLNQLPTSISEPEQEAPSLWEIVWSDPITAPEFKQLAEFMNKKDDTGYLSNMKRSTAFYFSEVATSNFLKKNGLTRVIRGHEVINEGYKFNHFGSVITIFSCSRYCGAPNKAAAILVEGYGKEGYIKIISLDT